MPPNKRFPRVGARLFLFLLGLALAATLYRADTFLLKHFQERDLLRAGELLHGHASFWGPETSAGGRIPGSFYIFLLALPIGLGGHWQATLPFLSLLFGVAAAGLGALVLARRGIVPALMAFAAVALTPLVVGEVVKNWNPSFAIPFVVWCLAAAVKAHEPGSLPRHWFVWGFAVALGGQVHAALLAFVAAALWLALTTPSQTRWRLVAVFFFGFSLAYLPALLGARGPHVPESPLNFGYFPRLIHAASNGGLLSRVCFGLGPTLLLALPLAARRGLGEGAGPAATAALRMAACQLPLATVYWLSGHGERYSIPFLLSLTAYFCLRLPRRIPPLLAGGTVLALALASIRDPLTPWSRLPWIGTTEAPRIRAITATETQALTRYARSVTDWSYSEFRWRTFTIGVKSDSGFQLAYEDAPRPPPGSVRQAPAGFVLVALSSSGLTTDAADRLVERLPAELTGGASLAVGESLCVSGGTVCAIPLRARDPVTYPSLMSNLGETYLGEPSPLRETLAHSTGNGPRIDELGDGTVLFSWRECGSVAADCRNGIAVKLADEHGKVLLEATVAGRTLSVPNKGLSPEWVEAWTSPYVEIGCHGSTERFELTSQIGETWRYEVPGLLAPFRRAFRTHCRKGEITYLEAGRGYARVTKFPESGTPVMLSPASLRWSPRRAPGS